MTKRHRVLECVVKVIKVSRKRGLSCRHDDNEAAYSLDVDNLDHGNFLKLISLLGKYHVCLKEHLNNVTEKSKHMPQVQKAEALVTSLSKTTADSVIDSIKSFIQESISANIHKAGMFSGQLDTTQDIQGLDQCSVFLRYVTDAVHERFAAVVRCDMTTGQSIVKLLTDVLEQLTHWLPLMSIEVNLNTTAHCH